MKTPHVLFLLPFPVFGAAEDYAAILTEGLTGHGWDATILAHADLPLSEPLVDRMCVDGTTLIRLSAARLANPLALARVLRQVPADLVHVNHVFLPGLAAGLMVHRVPLLVTCHTPALQVAYSWKARVLAAWTNPRVDGWVVLSKRNAQLLAVGLPSGRDRIHVVPPGLPEARFPHPDRGNARRRLGLPADAFVVGTVGRIARQKRHDVLVRAAGLASTRLPKLRLVILGDGELRGDIQILAQRLLPGRVLFAGHREDVLDLLPAFDVFCMTSDFEGLPFALLEAMAMGLTIVTTDVQGAGEAVLNEVHGLLVPRDSPERVAEAVMRLAEEPALARQLGVCARQRFIAEYTASIMVERTEALYRRFIA